MLDQAQFIRQFNETYREEFNPELFERDNQEIIDAIHEVVKSCERDKYYTLKLLSFDVIENYEDIYNTLRNHEEKRKKKNSKSENTYDFINIRDTDMILIKIEWLVRHNGIERIEEDTGTIEVVNPEQVLEVLIAVPRFTRKYYFRLSGNYYTTVFQIVDGSTYNNSTASQSKVDTVTMKTMFMPIRIFRSFNKNMVDVNTNKSPNPIEYQSIIFNNTVNTIYYILAAYGLYGGFQFMEINCIFLSLYNPQRSDLYTFEKHGIFINVDKRCFDADSVVQSLTATIYDGILKDATIDDLFNQRYWLRVLGMAFKNASIEKGLFVLDSIDGIYDNITLGDLHLPMKDKENIYCVLRWLMREFSNLRSKENTDVRTKKIRIADYIAAVYAAKLSRGIHRISDMGTRVTLKKVIQAVYTAPMFLISNITGASMSNLISYRDLVNDLDSMTALGYTYKGISGLGEDGASIQPVYRYVDPSHIGILDMDASSASDPGMSGMICPMAKLYGNDMSFSDYQEPNEWRENYFPVQDKLKEGTRAPITFDKAPDGYDVMGNREKIVQEELDINRIRCPISNINDPSILYTCSQAEIDKINVEPTPSLFTIIPDEARNRNTHVNEYNYSSDDDSYRDYESED